MIDSHCHLTDERFTDDLDAVMQRAAAAGVAGMVTIADSLEDSEHCVAIAQKYEQIFCSVGVHPHHAKEWKDGDLSRLRSLAPTSAKIVAIGEIGLDYHYDFSSRDVQRSVFQEQLALAKELHMPVVVHCREAVEDVWLIVDAVRPEKLAIHCCTERWEDVQRFVERGYILSFTGIATYPRSEEVRRTIQMCPLERMMVETDAPYLLPEALRAKGGRSMMNESAYVVEVAKCLAQVKGISLEEVDRVTTENAVGFFGLPALSTVEGPS
ncbi:TatD family hydrolase [Candidatus Peregrinibacteria bacterium]|nr:TatD family hydrolase [Candidatus Peregrinibacteria bacterium]